MADSNSTTPMRVAAQVRSISDGLSVLNGLIFDTDMDGDDRHRLSWIAERLAQQVDDIAVHADRLADAARQEPAKTPVQP